MENYIKTRNFIRSVCSQSGLSLPELVGVLSECLGEVRDAMLSEMAAEIIQLKDEGYTNGTKQDNDI